MSPWRTVYVPRWTHDVKTVRTESTPLLLSPSLSFFLFKHIRYLVRHSSALRFVSLFTLQLNWFKPSFGSNLKLQTQQELNAAILRFRVNNSNKHQMSTSSVSKTAEFTGSGGAFVIGKFSFLLILFYLNMFGSRTNIADAANKKKKR